MRRRHNPYADRLGEQLDKLAALFDELLDASTIVADTLNKPGSSLVFLDAAPWQWGPSSPEVHLLRMQVKGDYTDWYQRLHLLFPHPTPEVASELSDLDFFIRGWLDRDATSDFSVPATVAEAKTVAAQRFSRFRALLAMVAASDRSRLRLIPDANSVVNNPDLATYGRPFGGPGFTIHLVPTVLAELDKIKDQGKTQELRDKVRGFNRRLKGLRNQGNLADGVALTKTISVRTEAREPNVRETLDWLDPAVPDDRIAAAALRLQSDHPGDTVVLVTSDLGLQTKADAIGLPYEETPPTTNDLQADLDPSIAWEAGEYSSHVLKLTIVNKGRAAARDVTFKIASPPGGSAMTFRSGPWTAEKIGAGRPVVETVGSMFTEDGIVSATWTDDDGDHERDWPVKADPPPPAAIPHSPPYGYR